MFAEAEEHELTEDTRYMVLPPVTCMEAYTGGPDKARVYLEQLSRMADLQGAHQDAISIAQAEVTLAYSEGRFEDVRRSFEIVQRLGQWLDAELPVVICHAAVWAEDLDVLRQGVKILDAQTTNNDWMTARRSTVSAGLAALEGDKDRAALLYNEAMILWKRLQIPLDTARAQIDMAISLGIEKARPEAEAAIAFFTEAGNDAFAARIRERVGL
jgi:hypothetical protein